MWAGLHPGISLGALVNQTVALLGVALFDLSCLAPRCIPSPQALEAAAKAQGKTVEQFLADAAKGTAAAK